MGEMNIREGQVCRLTRNGGKPLLDWRDEIAMRRLNAARTVRGLPPFPLAELRNAIKGNRAFLVADDQPPEEKLRLYS